MKISRNIKSFEKIGEINWYKGKLFFIFWGEHLQMQQDLNAKY